MRKLDDLVDELIVTIDNCVSVKELSLLEDKIWGLRCEANDAQDDELVVAYDCALQVLGARRFNHDFNSTVAT